MLDSPAAEISPPSGEPRKLWSRDLVYWVFAFAFVSAAGVFFLLYHRDSSAVSQALVASVSIPQNETRRTATAVERSAPSLSAETSAPSVAPVADVPKRGHVDSESLPVRLTRGRSYQSVGPIKIRLVKVDLRRHTCDLNFQSRDRRFVQRRFQVNRAIQVKVGKNTPTVEVTVSSIGRDSVVLALDDVQPNMSVAAVSK